VDRHHDSFTVQQQKSDPRQHRPSEQCRGQSPERSDTGTHATRWPTQHHEQDRQSDGSDHTMCDARDKRRSRCGIRCPQMPEGERGPRRDRESKNPDSNREQIGSGHHAETA
jgi:hypothetical protein